MMKKIYSLEKLAILTAKIKNKSKSIVLCHGVFDLLHVGHIKHLIKAKEFGDKLVVTITSDNYVNKGPGKPLFNQRLRTEAIAALEIVDYVAINDSLNAVKPIRLIKPNVYCKGKDYNNLKDVNNLINALEKTIN